VVRLYRAGHAIEEVAAAVVCTVWQVRTVLLKLGVKLRGRAGDRGDDFSPPSVSAESAAALYAAGAGLERVAAKAGVSRKQAKRMLRDQQVPMRGRAEATRHPEQSRKISDQTVARRYRAGATLESLAIAAGSNAPVIRRILTDQGVGLRRKLAQLHISEEQITSLYRNGSSLDKIAAQAGCSRDVIRRILRRDGVTIRTAKELNIQRGVKPQITAEAMQASYEAGNTLSQIAAAAEINLARVANILHRRGLKLRGRGATRLADTERVKIPPEQMVELYAAGSTLVQITALAGSDRKRITAILKRRGVTIRSRR
jgi:lambda repressor-like predicted transcriptional regulator/transposase-like protein